MSRVIKSSKKDVDTKRYKITSDYWEDEYAKTLFGAYIHYYAMRFFSFGRYTIEIVDRAFDNV